MTNEPTSIADVILEWDEFHWSGHVPELGSLGKEIELHIETKDEERVAPHPLQVDAWKRIVSQSAHYAELVRSGLFKHYCAIRPQYEKAGPDWIVSMPIITNKEEIDGMLSINYIRICWPYDEKTPAVGFSYGCQWDREHGAGIIIKGDEIINAGAADCLYSS